MANPEHLAILKQGVEQWNKWREEHPEVERPNLSEANLVKANLSEANLYKVVLYRAKLSGAKLSLANLSGAELIEANLGRANLGAANLGGSNLTSANLSQANLINADLSAADLSQTNLSAAILCRADVNEANLSGADFTEAGAGNTSFANVDLSVAKGLETVQHNGPSSVGIDTIYKSRGKIPEVFLRGCGVPDEFIAYIGSMVGRPIEYYSCFISYSSDDRAFAERLYADLQAKGIRCWFAPHDMHGGLTIHEQIDEAIRLHDKVLLILSEHSMSSDWVKTEWAKARKRDVKEGKRVLFPVRLVTYEAMQNWEYIDSSGKDLAEEVRQYFILDFSTWKEHDSYQAAFGKLVGDLKAERSG